MPSRARWWAGRWIGPWPAGGNRSPRAGDQETAASPRGGSSLRSRSAICQRRIRGFAREAWNDSEYESASEPLRQRQLGKLHQDFEAGGNLRERIRGLRAFACEPRTVHRAVLQSAAVALGAGLQLSGRV